MIPADWNPPSATTEPPCFQCAFIGRNDREHTGVVSKRKNSVGRATLGAFAQNIAHAAIQLSNASTLSGLSRMLSIS